MVHTPLKQETPGVEDYQYINGSGLISDCSLDRIAFHHSFSPAFYLITNFTTTMKLQLAIALAATVIRGALANPVPEPAPATDAAAKGPQTCNILADSLNCRYHPYTDSSIVHVFHGGSAYFTCDHRGTTVSGNP